MFVVTRHLRSSHVRMGDIIHLQNVQQAIQLVPKFGRFADTKLTKDNSMEIGKDFYVNSYASKDTFHAILSYQ